MRREVFTSRPAGVVNNDLKRTRRDLARIQQFKAAGSGVARIGERLATGILFAFVEFDEALPGHIDFTAHFKPPRRIIRQRKRNRFNRSHVGGHIVTDRAVAAGCGPRQPAVFVKKRYGNAVDFRLDDIGKLFPRQLPGDHRRKIGELAFAVGLVERLHGRLVSDLRKTFERRAGDSLRRRGGIEKLRITLLQPQELVVEKIVIAVADNRSRLHVIQTVVPVDFPAQKFNARFYGSVHRFFLPRFTDSA